MALKRPAGHPAAAMLELAQRRPTAMNAVRGRRCRRCSDHDRAARAHHQEARRDSSNLMSESRETARVDCPLFVAAVERSGQPAFLFRGVRVFNFFIRGCCFLFRTKATGARGLGKVFVSRRLRPWSNVGCTGVSCRLLFSACMLVARQTFRLPAIPRSASSAGDWSRTNATQASTREPCVRNSLGYPFAVG